MKLNTRLVQITPMYMFCRQVYDNMGSIRARQEGVPQYLPLQFGGLIGQKNTLDLEEVMEITDFDGAVRQKAGKAKQFLGKGD